MAKTQASLQKGRLCKEMHQPGLHVAVFTTGQAKVNLNTSSDVQ